MQEASPETEALLISEQIVVEQLNVYDDPRMGVLRRSLDEIPPFAVEVAWAILSRLRDASVADREGRFRAIGVLEPWMPRLVSASAGWDDAERRALEPLVTELIDVIDCPPLEPDLRSLIRIAGTGLHFDMLAGGDTVAPRFEAAIRESGEDEALLGGFLDLLQALPATGKPSKRWIALARALGDELEHPVALAAALLRALIDAPDHEDRPASHAGDREHHDTYLGWTNEPIALAVVRFAGTLADPTLLPLLRAVAAKTVTVVGGQYGSPRSIKVANASAASIAEAAVPQSLTELLALERQVRHGTLLRQIKRAIDALAAAQGLTRDELLERGVEAHDLDAAGRREMALSQGSARIEVSDRAAVLVYVDGNGTVKKSFPAAVKEVDADALALIKTDLKGIRKTIAAERVRLDGLLAAGRRWALEDWHQYYLDHPVTGRFARSLIWRFAVPGGVSTAGRPIDADTLVTVDGDSAPIPPGAEVWLWHPVDSPTEEVAAWRQHCLDHELAQPVKQAFREVYVVTPAERTTATYSNRFGAHIFRQVQARALMKGRGWSPTPLAWWDDGIDHGTAQRTFESFGVRAEFFFDPIIDVEPTGGDLYPLCTSDQVRFHRGEEALELVDVPRLVFTEAMRDIDLFVAVTSIGADPEWLDHGMGRELAEDFRDYWNDVSFGDLTAAADVRREVIAGLLPRLAITDRCTLLDRFLEVRGDRTTYKIHLGSGNIQMAPNDEYLCIVAARDGRAGKLFLPFDDDAVLSLILSKAFLLAEDAKITDETILAQIGDR